MRARKSSSRPGWKDFKTLTEEDPNDPRTYESATARLEEIIQRLDSGEAQLRETLELCGEAKGLIEYCAGELAAVDQGLKELKLEDLASSLSGGQTAPGGSAPAAPGGSAPAAPGGSALPGPGETPSGQPGDPSSGGP